MAFLRRKRDIKYNSHNKKTIKRHNNISLQQNRRRDKEVANIEENDVNQEKGNNIEEKNPTQWIH